MDNYEKIRLISQAETSFEMAEKKYQLYIKGEKYISNLTFALPFFARAQVCFSLANDPREKEADKRWDECASLIIDHTRRK